MRNSETRRGRAHTVTALGHLYAGAAAHLRADEDGTNLLVEQALGAVPLGALLDVGALTVAELLRDIAANRGTRATALLSILLAARRELVEEPDVYTVLLHGVASYLHARPVLWRADDLCDLAACPTETLTCLITLLAATITWRSEDAGTDPLTMTGYTCLRLAERAA